MPPTPSDLPTGYPFKPEFELTPREAHAALAAGSLLLVDVRTQPEWDRARVQGSIHIPLDQLEKRWDEIEPIDGQQVAILCHHGVRSMKATLMLRQLGLANVKSVAGGIDQWSLTADASVPRYTR
jgi:rhodanese-related sulfurtransferase